MHSEIETWQTWRWLQGAVPVGRSILVLSFGAGGIGICKAVMGWMSASHETLLSAIISLSSAGPVLAGLAG